MTFNAMSERYEEITVCGQPALSGTMMSAGASLVRSHPL